MDEKGFIFTTDAILALVVMIVFTGSIVTYGFLPIYQGEYHQHLEAIADSALETMEQSGVLREAAVEYSNGNITGAEFTLRSSLDTVLTMSNNNPISDDNGIISANDVVTKVKVISGPQEGWMGRAFYKQDEVQFQDISSTSVTTLWNFHNYLKNYVPWSGTNGLYTYKYWGGTNTNPQNSKNITFYIPGPVNSAKLLLGSSAGNNYIPAYNADVVINNYHNYIKNNSFLYLYTSTGQGPIYNYQKNLDISTLNNGNNNFFIQFNATANQNMPWFSIIGNYSTILSVPKGIANTTIPFGDIAGVGRPTAGTLYNLDTGVITTTPGRSISWNTLQNDNFQTDLSTPFELTGIPNGGNGIGSAVASIQTITIPPGNRLFDAFTVVNAFGGEDGCIVQVQDSIGNINTTFASFINTTRTDGGYGFVPGIVNIQPWLKTGTNKVRIITWDNVPGNDYDLVGLESSYSTITYSKFPIRWDTFPFANHQNTSTNTITTETQIKNFRIDADAQSALLFIGVGVATRNIQVTIQNSTGAISTLYPSTSPIPYVINLGERDANPSQPTHIITSIIGDGTLLKPGSYTLTVKVTPSLAYESGDGGSKTPTYGSTGDPSIFSGTRISIIYPKFLQNIWATGYANNPQDAAYNARNYLIQILNEAGYTNIDLNLIKNNTIYTGNVPNVIPVRLELWKK